MVSFGLVVSLAHAQNDAKSAISWLALASPPILGSSGGVRVQGVGKCVVYIGKSAGSPCTWVRDTTKPIIFVLLASEHLIPSLL